MTLGYTPTRGRLLADIADNLRFFTRLPLSGRAAPPDFRRVGWAAPLAGALVGAIGALGLVGARALGFPTLLSATLAVMLQIFATGALHEDGLADVADGFGGGRDRDSKLAIMRDSRIGVYGALALGLSLLLRIEAIGVMTRPSVAFAAAGLVLAGAVARAAALAAIAAALGFVTLEVVRALFACAIAAGVARLFVALARRHIGGQTGDVCGASAALGEIAALLALLIGGRDAY